MLQQQEVIGAAGQCSWECARGLGRWRGEAKEDAPIAGPTGCLGSSSSHPSSTYGLAGTGSAGPAHRSTPAPESGLIVPGGDVGLPVWQLWGRVVSYLHTEVGVWPQSSKFLGPL